MTDPTQVAPSQPPRGRDVPLRLALRSRRARASASLGLALLALSACGPSKPAADPQAALREGWYQRARQSYRAADLSDAADAAAKAVSPGDSRARQLAAVIALARLDYPEALRQLEGLSGTLAAGLRGRALWYQGRYEEAAAALEALLMNPEVVDPWAKQVSTLARGATGRTPYALSGSMVAVVETPFLGDAPPMILVPVEVDGESILALVSTGVPELVLDSSSRHDPSWVSLRFADRFEVRDVPAQVQDLGALSKQVGAPVRALLGVELLRRLNVTLDYQGRQFVARSFEPPRPPGATRLDPLYAKGGGLVVPVSVGAPPQKALLAVDTASGAPLALDAGGWTKAGVDPAKLLPAGGGADASLRTGLVRAMGLGDIQLAEVPGVFGAPVDALETSFSPTPELSLDVDGILGAGVLSAYRVTFGESGRKLWLEDHEQLDRELFGASRPAGESEP